MGPVTSTWVLPLPEFVRMVFTERLLARTMIARSIKVLGWQMLVAKSREHDFAKKCPNFFSKFIGPVTSMCELLFPETVHMVFTERLLASKLFCDVNKSACMATGGKKIPGAGFSKKSVDFMKFHEPVAPLWLL